MADISLLHVAYYVNPQERKPQAQRDWLDLLQGRAHNVHKVDVCALSLLRYIAVICRILHVLPDLP